MGLTQERGAAVVACSAPSRRARPRARAGVEMATSVGGAAPSSWEQLPGDVLVKVLRLCGSAVASTAFACGRTCSGWRVGAKGAQLSRFLRRC